MITDELRNLAVYLDSAAAGKSEHGFSPVALRLNRIADHIEQKHDEELARAQAEVLADCVSVANDFIELPKDADGKAIRLGDRLDWNGSSFVVDVLELDDDGWWTRNDGLSVKCSLATHAKPDSWESIIEDAAKNIYPNGAFNPCWDEVRDSLVERCKRLCEQERANEV